MIDRTQTQKVSVCLAEVCRTWARLCCAISQLEPSARPPRSSLRKYISDSSRSATGKWSVLLMAIHWNKHRSCLNSEENIKLDDMGGTSAKTTKLLAEWLQDFPFQASGQVSRPENLPLAHPKLLAWAELPPGFQVLSGSQAEKQGGTNMGSAGVEHVWQQARPTRSAWALRLAGHPQQRACSRTLSCCLPHPVLEGGNRENAHPAVFRPS